MPIDYRGAFPFWYYSKIALAEAGVSLGPQYLVRQIKSGFNYWLKGFLISFPHSERVQHANDVTPPIYMSLVQSERNRDITETAIPFELFANPGGSEPPPPGHAQHARPLFNGFIRWDYLISNSDVIKLKITGHAGGFPAFCRLAIVGYNLRQGNHV